MKKTNLFLQLILIPVDYLAVWGALLSAYYLRGFLGSAFIMPLNQFLQFTAVLSLVWLLVYAVLGLYSSRLARMSLDEFLRVVLGSVAASLLAGSLIFLVRQVQFSRLVLGIGGAFSALFVEAGRIMLGWGERWLHRRGYGIERVLLVGDNREVGNIVEGFRIERDPRRKLVGVVAENVEVGKEVSGIPVVGNLTSLGEVVEKLEVDEIVLADTSYPEEEVLKIVNLAQDRGLRFRFVPDTLETITAVMKTDELAGYPIIELKLTALSGLNAFVKRLMDIVLALIGLVILAPVLLVTALLIKLDSPGTIFFKHWRVGQFGEEFELIKFRSMYMMKKGGKLVHASENKEIERLKEQQENYKLEADPRVTRVGRIIRKTSIDELPQLWNVLWGKMSIVGPRPYMKRELDKRVQEYPETKELIRRVLLAKPGITGLWQVSGRSEVKFSERIAMDAYYVTHANLWMDLKIILKTLPAVLEGKGAM